MQAVAKTVDEAVQAGPLPHQECQPQQGILVLAEQAGQPLPARLPLPHRLDDLLCRDAEYPPAALGIRDRDRVDRERDRERELEDFTKMLENSLKKQ